MKAELTAALGNTQCLEQQLGQAEQTLGQAEQGNSSICTNTLFGLVWLRVVWLRERALELLLCTELCHCLGASLPHYTH